MRITMRITTALLALLLSLPGVSAHADTLLPGKIPLGGVCLAAGADPGPMSEWGARDATCASNSCDPGPASEAVRKGGEKVAWYCSARVAHCAYPKRPGVMKGTRMGSGECSCDPADIADGRCQGVPHHAVAALPTNRPAGTSACDPASPFEGCH
jgi:hypothetical protein